MWLASPPAGERRHLGGSCESRMKRILLILAALAYIVSPIDLIPDFIPVAGWGDDLVVLLLALNQARGLFRGTDPDRRAPLKGSVIHVAPSR